MDWGNILQNKTEIGLKINTNGHLNSRIRERRTPQIPTNHPNQTTALDAPVDSTKLWIHSNSTGAPHRLFHSNKSRQSQKFRASIRNMFLLYTRIQTKNASHTKHIYSWTIKITKETAEKVVQHLNYAATQSWAITHYHASAMTLLMHIDALFLSAPGTNSREGGHH